MRIYAVNSREPLTETDYKQFLKWIDKPYRERISRFHFWQDRQRSLLGRLLGKYAIIKNFGLKNDDIHYDVNAYGKPFIVGKKRFILIYPIQKIG